MTPLEAAARAVAKAYGCEEEGDPGATCEEPYPCGACQRIAREALKAAVPAIPEKRLDALRFAVTPEEVRGVLLRALVGETSVSGKE